MDYPFLAIIGGVGAASLLVSYNYKLRIRGIVFCLLFWHLLTCINARPDYMAYFNELANRLTALILPIILVELSILASGATSWEFFVIGFFTGLLAGVGTKTSQTTYDKQILQTATPEEIKFAKEEAAKQAAAKEAAAKEKVLAAKKKK